MNVYAKITNKTILHISINNAYTPGPASMTNVLGYIHFGFVLKWPTICRAVDRPTFILVLNAMTSLLGKKTSGIYRPCLAQL